jgi:hypothetical protein
MSYRAEVTTAVTNNCNWYSRETFSTTNVLTTVPITAPTDETINYRLIREIQQKHM